MSAAAMVMTAADATVSSEAARSMVPHTQVRVVARGVGPTAGGSHSHRAVPRAIRPVPAAGDLAGADDVVVPDGMVTMLAIRPRATPTVRPWRSGGASTLDLRVVADRRSSTAARLVPSEDAVAPPALPIGEPARIRLTARGRAVVNGLLFAAALTIAIVLGSTVGSLTQVGTGQPAADTLPLVTVESGTTLWAIAASVADDHRDVRDVVAEIMSLNDLASADLTPGQSLRIPASD